ncbi:nucleoside recognition domain-containing protein [Anaerotignum sp.]|uniref:nucleoside recognition domain-containing protein n=1 Tax=Anaerotignum sp. TaxID=2039241 RepID=UPI002897501B|nr:nucleoside recognition domain-containing protein [Anaerotignum sp.]
MDTNQKEEKVTIKGWISLIVLCVMFSGIFKDVDGPLKALDFLNLSGGFGKIGETGQAFIGSGGTGAKEGFLQALSLIPAVSFALAMIDTVTELGAMKAAVKLFNPILQPILGIPGSCGISFVATFTSSDVGAVMTKQLYEEGKITDKQRSIFAAYQYAGSAVILNTINTQAPLLPIVLLAIGPIIILLFLCKLLGANLVRFYLTMKEKKAGGSING